MLLWLLNVHSVTYTSSRQHDQPGRRNCCRCLAESLLVYWQMCLMLIVVSVVTIGPFKALSTCDVWLAQLIGVKEGKGIWFDSSTKLYYSNGFLTSIFPIHLEAWTKIIWV